MELMAAIAALEKFDQHGRTELCIISDSEYLVKGMNERICDWKERGWKTKKDEPVANVDLWKRLWALEMRHDIEWIWVRGHNGDKFNELADHLANEAAIKLSEVRPAQLTGDVGRRRTATR